MYVREAGPKEFPQTFKEWMDAHSSLRDMIAEGRGKLEWERKIPDEKLVDLKEMLASKDFKTNLPKVSFLSLNVKRNDASRWNFIGMPNNYESQNDVLWIMIYNNFVYKKFKCVSFEIVISTLRAIVWKDIS